MNATAKRTLRLGFTVGLSLGAIVGLVGCSEMADDGEGSSDHAVESINGLNGVNGLNGGRIVFAPGAVPLIRDGEVIGAIGVGGSGGESDSEIAALAAKLLDS